MKEVDDEGVSLHKAYMFNKRVIIHWVLVFLQRVDSQDKLTAVGLCIHAVIEWNIRRIIGLDVGAK